MCLIHSHTVVIILKKDHGLIDLGIMDMVTKCLGCSNDGVTLLVVKIKGLSFVGRSGRRVRSNLLLLQSINNNILVSDPLVLGRRHLL